jgi:hypothetical protein
MVNTIKRWLETLRALFGIWKKKKSIEPQSISEEIESIGK